MPSLPQLAAGRPHLLASVRSAQEAMIAITGGAAIIDAKDPEAGALGAVDSTTLQAIRSVVPRTTPLSATTGDIPAGDIDGILNEILRVAKCGADLVKIAVVGDGDQMMQLLAELGQRRRLQDAYGRRVAVLFADRTSDWSIIEALPAAGFAGVMLDTQDKTCGSLLDIVSPPQLAEFIVHARRVGMFAGLAGALRLRHIPMVTALDPDVMGFRGALCRQQCRTASMDADAVIMVRKVIERSVIGQLSSAAHMPSEP